VEGGSLAAVGVPVTDGASQKHRSAFLLYLIADMMITYSRDIQQMWTAERWFD